MLVPILQGWLSVWECWRRGGTHPLGLFVKCMCETCSIYVSVVEYNFIQILTCKVFAGNKKKLKVKTFRYFLMSLVLSVS